METSKDFFSEQDKETIIASIRDAEKETSGEIRLHVENRCPRDPVHRAKELFQKLDMHKTEKRNGVLVYISVEDHNVAIWGDEGINFHVGQAFWDDEVQVITNHFKNGKYAEGVSKAILQVGENLKKYFPYHNEDKNELTDDISVN
jgi:uncharacterized membrane protein